MKLPKKHLIGISMLALCLCESGIIYAQEFYAPEQKNKFVTVYHPKGDYFFGPDSKYLTEGKWYDDWVVNDHAIIKAEDGKWHIIGITHPEILTEPLNEGIHHGEWASFHALSYATDLKNTLEENHYDDLSKILPPKDRPGEIKENQAPYIIKKEGLYIMVYGHSPIRYATSPNLYDWTPMGNLFDFEMKGARDPHIFYHNDTYYLVLCKSHAVAMCTSKDLKNWTNPKDIFTSESFDPESPSIVFYEGSFYMFICSWDGKWDKKEIVGAYQHKTYVLKSDDIYDFGKDTEKSVATLNAHAPEVFQDEDGQWYISSAEWPRRGVSIDKLDWTKIKK